MVLNIDCRKPDKIHPNNKFPAIVLTQGYAPKLYNDTPIQKPIQVWHLKSLPKNEFLNPEMELDLTSNLNCLSSIPVIIFLNQ